MPTEIKLPDLGENIEEGDVISLLVAVGDTVIEDQALLEMETGKATIEVPASAAGVVREILIKEGDKARVGQVILTLDGSNNSAPAPTATQEEPSAPPTKDSAPAPEPTPGEAVPQAEELTVLIPPEAPSPANRAEGIPIAAAPSVRKFARELGIDIYAVPGSGRAGRISIEDVKAHTKNLIQRGPGVNAATGPVAAPLPDFTKWGEVDVQPMSTIRRLTAEHMTRCWSNIPHVTQQDDADITILEELRKRWKSKVKEAGGKLTPTAMLLKIVGGALKAFPQFTSSIDPDQQQIIVKKYIHIGVAVDTPKGLVVPVIRDVDQKNITELAVELTELADKARDGKVSPDDLQGSVFTITNLGGIGGTYFTPIVNHPNVAILGVGRGSMQPFFTNGAFEPRLMLPLSLSYDHRVIDGADGARFLRWLCEAIDEPMLLALEG